MGLMLEEPAVVSRDESVEVQRIFFVPPVVPRIFLHDQPQTRPAIQSKKEFDSFSETLHDVAIDDSDDESPGFAVGDGVDI